MKTQWMLICALIFALVTAVFAVINVESVSVNFLFAQSQFPLILVILGSTLLGGLIVGFFGIIRQFRLQRMIRQLRRQVEALEKAAEDPMEKVAAEGLPGNAGKLPESDAGTLPRKAEDSPHKKPVCSDTAELAGFEGRSVAPSAEELTRKAAQAADNATGKLPNESNDVAARDS